MPASDCPLQRRLTILGAPANSLAKVDHDEAKRFDRQDLLLAIERSELGVLQLVTPGRRLEVCLRGGDEAASSEASWRWSAMRSAPVREEAGQGRRSWPGCEGDY